jgi:glucokinase
MSHPPVVLGLDFGGTKIATAVYDLAGSKLGGAVVDSLGELGGQASLDRGIEAAHTVLDSTASGAHVAAVGVSTFGIPRDDRVDLAPAIGGWESLDIGRQVRAAFAGAHVEMATDAKAAAVAEARWGSLIGCDPAVYLNLGTGTAAAIVIAGQVVSGSHGAAGEIGYNLRAPQDVGLTLRQRIILEDMVSGGALARRAASAGLLTAAEVFRVSKHQPVFAELVSDFVVELGFHLVNLAILIDPVRIAVGGGMVRSWPQLRPGLERALQAGVPFPPELVIAQFPDDAPLLGAVALALDAAAGSPPQPPAIAGTAVVSTT